MCSKPTSKYDNMTQSSDLTVPLPSIVIALLFNSYCNHIYYHYMCFYGPPRKYLLLKNVAVAATSNETAESGF